MTPADIDRVFGRDRLRMVTGDHVEVFREQSVPGERRRYTKRFLATSAGDFREWTEREWRILARLVGHGIKPVPDVVQFDRGAADRPALVQTYDAGITVDHWATLLPLERDGSVLRNAFENCAHWWALARHCLIALDAIHELHVVHLDLKADNVCIPVGPADFNPPEVGSADFDPVAGKRSLQPRFEDIALIDFAFSLVSGEPLHRALPIAAQPDYEYQSSRLLRALEAGRHGDLAPTRRLDWRCDFFSLAAMLSRYLPELDDCADRAWTRPRHAKARTLVRRLIELHDAELPQVRPHAELVALAGEQIAQPDLRLSLQRGWSLAIDASVSAGAAPTPVTRIAPALDASTPPGKSLDRATARTIPLDVPVAPETPHAAASAARPPVEHAAMSIDKSDVDIKSFARRQHERQQKRKTWWTAGLAIAAAAGIPLLVQAWTALRDAQTWPDTLVGAIDATRAQTGVSTAPTTPIPQPEAMAPAVPVATEAAPAPAASPPPTPSATERTATKSTATTEPTTTESTSTESASTEPTTKERAAADRAPAATAPPTVASASSVAPATPRPTKARVERPMARTAPASLPVASSRPAFSTTAAASARRHPAGASRAATASAASMRGARSRVAFRTNAVPAAFPSRQAVLAQAQAAAQAQVRAQAQAQRPSSVETPVATRTQAPPRDTDAAQPWAVTGKTPPSTVGSPPSSAPLPSSTPPASPAPLASSAPLTIATPLAVAVATPGPARPPSLREAEATSLDFGARADDLMANHVPRWAQRAERLVARVLFLAGRSDNVVGDGELRDSAAGLGRAAPDATPAMATAPREAQQLDAAARNEYARRGATAQALQLQVRAFGANPLDPEVAGNLAFLLLRTRPAQPEAARRLALHALTLRGARYPQGRVEDWATLAIASALSGRDRDARNALLVSLAVAPSLDRQCRAALDVYAMYGERLRAPVEAMLHSAHASAGAQPPPFCEWPPHWTVSGAMR